MSPEFLTNTEKREELDGTISSHRKMLDHSAYVNSQLTAANLLLQYY